MDPLTQKLFLAIERGDAGVALPMLQEHPELLKEHISDLDTWLSTAITGGNESIVRTLLDMGCDVNGKCSDPKTKTLPLTHAIRLEKDEIVNLLIAHGADCNPQNDRPMIAAVNSALESSRRLRYVKQLVEHGADVNRLYDLYGNWDHAFTVLDWTDDPEVASFLRSIGAKTALELKEKPRSSGDSRGAAAEVVAYFQDQVGNVDSRALVDLVAAGTSQIAINVIRATNTLPCVTLFTTGLSNKAMNVPHESDRDFAYAELYLQLPSHLLQNNKFIGESVWAIKWMRRIAQYPQEQNTWLGGPFAIIANNDPPEPLARDTRFCAWMLLADKWSMRTDGERVNLYRMLPLFANERAFEQMHGAASLLKLLDEQEVGMIIDFERQSVVTE